MVVGVIFVLVLVSFGIIFVSLLVHEGVHVVQSPGPVSVCYDFGQVTVMHVLHNTSSLCVLDAYNSSRSCDEDIEFNKFRLFTEKCAFVFERFLSGILFVIFFMLLQHYYAN